jgi:MFS family permease
MVRQAKRQLQRAVIASIMGTSIEWYDFFLYGSASALVFPRLFFPTTDRLSGVLISFATYAVGFAARPLGAAIFGHYGDRIGRKGTLIVTLVMMGLGTAAIGVVPGYATIGIAGGVLITLLRVVQGIGVGGEWAGAVLLCMEWGSKPHRGLISSWPQIGVPIGLVSGNAALLVFNQVSGDGFLTWGWRAPFVLSLVLMAVGLYIRLGILETPIFTTLLEHRRIERLPVVEVVKRNHFEIVLSTLVRVSEQAPFYVFTSFVLVYGTTTLKFSNAFMLSAVMIAALFSLITVPLSGHLSDRYGRKRICTFGVLATAACAFPYFGLLGSGVAGLVLLAVIASLVTHDVQYGPQAALIAENFTGRLRYSGASIGYQLASVIAGGPAPLIATTLLADYHSPVAIGWYVVLCSVVSLAALALIPNRSHLSHGVEYDEVTSVEAGVPAIAGHQT